MVFSRSHNVISHRVGIPQGHVRLNNIQHVRGDFIHILKRPHVERYHRPVVLRQEGHAKDAHLVHQDTCKDTSVR